MYRKLRENRIRDWLRLPCHNLNLWENISALLKESIDSPEKLDQVLNDIEDDRVNTRYFFHLNEQKDYFFGKTLPFIQNLALRLPILFPDEDSVPLLLPGKNMQITLTQEKVACILANVFMHSIRNQDMPFKTHPKIAWPRCTFSTIFSRAYGTTASTGKCLLHYFDRIRQSMPQGHVTFTRKSLEREHVPDWSKSTKKIVKIIADSRGKIETSSSLYHADFANEYIGGGALGGGCVQEEILFAIKPECLLSMLICAKMEPEEAIFITGAEQFSKYVGYGHSFKWGGDYIDPTPRDKFGRIRTTIVALDAIYTSHVQWKLDLIKRDLVKAYSAFVVPESVMMLDDIIMVGDSTVNSSTKTTSSESTTNSSCAPLINGGTRAIATGNWGCGAFGGDKSLKVFQQIMAASEAEINMQYYTFGEEYKGVSLETQINKVCKIAEEKGLTVGDFWKALQLASDYASQRDHKPNLFEIFIQMHASREN